MQGEGIYSYIHVLPETFLFKLINLDLISKRSRIYPNKILILIKICFQVYEQAALKLPVKVNVFFSYIALNNQLLWLTLTPFSPNMLSTCQIKADSKAPCMFSAPITLQVLYQHSREAFISIYIFTNNILNSLPRGLVETSTLSSL